MTSISSVPRTSYHMNVGIKCMIKVPIFSPIFPLGWLVFPPPEVQIITQLGLIQLSKGSNTTRLPLSPKTLPVVIKPSWQHTFGLVWPPCPPPPLPPRNILSGTYLGTYMVLFSYGSCICTVAFHVMTSLQSCVGFGGSVGFDFIWYSPLGEVCYWEINGPFWHILLLFSCTAALFLSVNGKRALLDVCGFTNKYLLYSSFFSNNIEGDYISTVRRSMTIEMSWVHMELRTVQIDPLYVTLLCEKISNASQMEYIIQKSNTINSTKCIQLD